MHRRARSSTSSRQDESHRLSLPVSARRPLRGGSGLLHRSILALTVGGLATGCGQPPLSATVSNRADLDSPLYALIETYLVGDLVLTEAAAARFCRDEDATDCLIRLEALTPATRGAASTLILYVATDGADFPGLADPAAVTDGGWGVDPAVFAATESVGHDDVLRKYDFDCRFVEGEIRIDQALEVPGTLSGDFDLILGCREALVPGDVQGIGITGRFATDVVEAPYPW